MKLTPLNITAYATLLSGLAVLYLFHNSNTLEAAYALLVAAGIDLLTLVLSKGMLDEETRRLRSIGAFLAFGAAAALFTIPTLNTVSVFFALLPLVYCVACAVALSRVPRGLRMPVTASGFVVPILYITGFFNAYAIAGWMIVASVLMTTDFDLRMPSKPKKGRGEVHIDDVNTPPSFEPIREL